MAGHRRTLALGVAIAVSGCMPIPYKPAASVTYLPVTSEEASAVTVSASTRRGMIGVSSTYSEFIAAAVYGVATIARPQAALRDALAADVAHRLASAHPAGAIRLIVLAQDGGVEEGDPNHAEQPAAQAVTDAQRVGY
jgi:hypothetical protein